MNPIFISAPSRNDFRGQLADDGAERKSEKCLSQYREHIMFAAREWRRTRVRPGQVSAFPGLGNTDRQLYRVATIKGHLK